MAIVLLHVAVFAAFGPAIGTFAFGGGFGAMMAFVGLPLAYAENTDAAAVAGACVAVASSFVTTPWKLYGISAAIGAGAAASMGSVYAAQPDTGSGTVIFGLVGAVASVTCASLVRHLRLRLT